VNILQESDKTTIHSQQPDDEQHKQHNNKHKKQQNNKHDTRSKPEQNKQNVYLKQLIRTP